MTETSESSRTTAKRNHTQNEKVQETVKHIAEINKNKQTKAIKMVNETVGKINNIDQLSCKLTKRERNSIHVDKIRNEKGGITTVNKSREL